jgi:hypothetical protein
MPINRTAFNALVDDSGSGTDGTIVNKALIASVLLDPIDVALAANPGAWVGATAGQIPFPAVQVPSGGANVLDDYEEGTWTPTLGGTTTYGSQWGHYTKVGRLVSISCYHDWHWLHWCDRRTAVWGEWHHSGVCRLLPSGIESGVCWLLREPCKRYHHDRPDGSGHIGRQSGGVLR